MPNFFDKEKYVLYYENLQLDLRLGLKLNIYIYICIYIYIYRYRYRYRVSEFNQSQWLKPYVELIHKKEQKQKKDNNGKALRKSINITVYGKTMENVRDRIDVRLASNKKDYLK